MRNRQLLLAAALTVCMQTLAQGPNGSGTYYVSADGRRGSELKTALHTVINDHTVRTYDQLWTDFRTTDARSDGKVWDMYSGVTSYTFGTDQAGNYSQEGDVYNREHSFPKSWFNDASPMYTDLVHLVPTDGYVNGRRSNYPYGETNGETYRSKGAFSKLGASTLVGYSGTVFEPNDEYKGDFARIYFYMATCYENRIGSWSSDMLDGTSYPAFATWAINMLMEWAKDDPVSQKEIDRNNAIYGIQHNRNPFVDYPGLEQYVWGTMRDVAFSYDNYAEPEGTTVPDTGGDDDPAATGASYERINSTDELTTGVNYLMVYERDGVGESLAMGAQSGNYRTGVAVTAANGKIELSDAEAEDVRQLRLDGQAGAYTLYVVQDNVYLRYSGSGNSLNTTEIVTDDYARWNITFSGNNALIVNVAEQDRKVMYNTSAPRFACYKSEQGPVALYRQTTSTGIDATLNTTAESRVRVYSITGVMVRDGVEQSRALTGLPKGIYVMNGRKYVVR